jgi:hypothetical protein
MRQEDINDMRDRSTKPWLVDAPNFINTLWALDKIHKEFNDLKEKLRWIPVSERLPKHNSWVMVKEDTAVAMCWFMDGQFTDAYDSGLMFNVNISKIDSWREIPELVDGE